MLFRSRELKAGKTGSENQHIDHNVGNIEGPTSVVGNETDCSNSLVMEMTEMSDSLWDEVRNVALLCCSPHPQQDIADMRVTQRF